MRVLVSTSSTGVYVQKTVLAYLKKGYLQKFYTSLFDHKDYFLSKFLNFFGLFKVLRSRRNMDSIPISKIHGFFFLELLRTLAARYNKPRIAHWIWEQSEAFFDFRVSKHLSNEINVIHGYEHVSFRCFQKAKRLGIFTVYEQPSQHFSYFDKIYSEQLDKYPAFRSSKNQLLDNYTLRKVNNRKAQELELSDLIICNSSFTKNTLVDAGINIEKIEVVPLGFPTVKKSHSEKPDKFIVLYAGSLSLRKGIHLLIEVWKDYFSNSEADLWLVGKNELPKDFLTTLPDNIKLFENIPFAEMNLMYEKASAFVLPTLADGFGMVLTEAMAHGLCVIATNNSAGPDIITNEYDGLLIEAGNLIELKDVLEKIINNKPYASMIGKNAALSASMYTWENYERRLVSTVEKRYRQWKKI